jgi:hypothetical protein
MRKTIIVTTAGLALAFATAATAYADTSALTAQPEQMAQPISATIANDPSQVICHHLVHEGVLMRQQVCLTKRAWERMRLHTQQTVSDFQRHSFSVPMK